MHLAFYSFDNPSINLEREFSRNFSTQFNEISDIEGYILGGIDFNHNLFFQSWADIKIKNEKKFSLREDSLSKYWKAEQFRRASESRSYKKYSEALKSIDVNDLIIKDYIKVSEKDSTRSEYYYHYMKIKSKGLDYFNYGDF